MIDFLIIPEKLKPYYKLRLEICVMTRESYFQVNGVGLR